MQTTTQNSGSHEATKSRSEKLVTLHLDESGFNTWLAHFRRLGIAPPSYEKTLEISSDLAKYIFGDDLSKFGQILEVAE